MCVGFTHPSVFSDLDEIAGNIPNLLRVMSRNEIREQIGREPDDEDETVEPVAQNSQDQEDQNDRITDYFERKVDMADIVDDELYRLNQLYDRDEMDCVLSRTVRYIKSDRYSGTIDDVITLVRLIHIDYYTSLGFRNFQRVVHTGEFKCQTNCNLRAVSAENTQDVVLGCRCLVYPTTL